MLLFLVLILFVVKNNNGEYQVGDLVKIGSERFNVINVDDTTVTLLAKYNLGPDYRQSKKMNDVKFSDVAGWDWSYNSEPKEIDIQVWAPTIAAYINEYVLYLQKKTGDSSITGNLPTMTQLGELGCTINSDYKYEWPESYNNVRLNCKDSNYSKWLVNGQDWWTRSVTTGASGTVWSVKTVGGCYPSSHYGATNTIRPVIIVSKETLK